MFFLVNYWAVLLAAVSGMAIGAFWYSPLGFGKSWIKLMGLPETVLTEAKKKSMGVSYALAFLGQLVMACVFAHLIVWLNLTTLVTGMRLGFWIWLGFIATTFMNQVLWENKSWGLYCLNVAHYLVVMLVMTGILAIWR